MDPTESTEGSEVQEESQTKTGSSKNIFQRAIDRISMVSQRSSQHGSLEEETTSEESSAQMDSDIVAEPEVDSITGESPETEVDKEEKEISSHITDQISKAKSVSDSKSDPISERKGLEDLERLGFRKTKSQAKKKESEDTQPVTSKEVFEQTFKKFPQAMVSGKKISTSYILPKKQKTEIYEDVKGEDEGPIVLKQIFDEKVDKDPSEKKYFKKEPFSESLKSILRKRPSDSVAKISAAKSDQDTSLASVSQSAVPSSKLEKKLTDKSLLKRSVTFLNQLPDTPTKEEIDSYVYKRHSALLPEISSEGKVIHGTHQVTEDQLAIGEKGFIAQLLLDVMKEHMDEIPQKEPVHKADLAERRRVIEETDKELKAYFYRPKKSVNLTLAKSLMLKSKSTIKNLKTVAEDQTTGLRKESDHLALAKSSMLKSKATVMNLISKTAVPITDTPTVPGPKLSPAPDAKMPSPSMMNLTTEWRPGSLIELPGESVTALHQRRESWVGPYIIGTDYWTRVEVTAEEPEKVAFGMDSQQRPWYDISTSRSRFGIFGHRKHPRISRRKLQSLKKKLPETEVEYRKQGDLRDKEKGVTLEETWNEDLKDMFHEFTKSDELNKNRIILADVDKWLEMVGILDYMNLTLIQTGFCFYAAGGTRYKGLTFSEFKTFLTFISNASRMPFTDVVIRLKFAQLGISITKDDIEFKLD